MKTAAFGLCVLVLCGLSPAAARAGVARFCSGCDLKGRQLPSSDFSNAVYVGSNFEGANLGGSSFRGARIIAANFQNSDLRNASFDGADCIACNFNGALLDGTTFVKVRMVAANFKGFKAAVTDAQLRELLSGCISCNFIGGQFGKRDLSGVVLVAVDLSQADLRDANFTGAVLCWYDGNDAKRATICDTMAGAQTAGATFRNIQLCEDPLERRTCAPVATATLRSLSKSTLEGASLPQP
jgi:uncharacterized protein YjbI with pentapeptide repeats